MKEGSDPNKQETQKQEWKESTKECQNTLQHHTQIQHRLTADIHSPTFPSFCQSTATLGIVAPQGAFLSNRDTAVESKHQMC